MTAAKRPRGSAAKDLRVPTSKHTTAAKHPPAAEPKQSLIKNVLTGVPGLDAVLGGGLCEYSFNLVAGAPGSGKTTLVQQILFANATKERPALYFTVLGEPTV
jgi:predicted ATP-dependent serine protease